MNRAHSPGVDRPRRLLHIFPTFAVGGAQMRFARLVAAHGSRYHHTVLSLDGILDMRARLEPDAPVSCMAQPKSTTNLLTSVQKSMQQIREFNPDTLVTYNWGSMDWCLANRVWPHARRHVHIEDGFGPEEQTTQLKRRVLARRLALSNGNTLTVVPSKILESIAGNIWRLPPSKLRYIPNGINCARFAAGTTKPHADLTIGTVATLRREKNLARLIRLSAGLMDEFPTLRLVIVGDGPERTTLDAAAAQTAYAHRIVFAGVTPEPQRFLTEMDVFALTSDTEQMPLSVLEAMAAGLPIVSFDVGDVANMVAPENATYAGIGRNDDKGYTAALRAMLHSAALRARIGAANRTTALDRFDERVMAERYAELFG